MKQLLFLLFISLSVTAQKRYVATSGNDANAGTLAAPWKTMAKASTSSIAGDSIFFNRGDVFYGTFTAKANQKITAYGSGSKPILTGFTTLPSWTSVGGGVYYASLTADSMLSMVSIDDTLMYIARWPNIDSADKGYLHYQTCDSNITTHDCSPTKIRNTVAGNWTGTQMRVRSNDWTLSNVIVTADNSDTLTFADYFFLDIGGHPSLSPCKWNFGYFFVNKLSFLDHWKEYYYDRATSRLYVYFGSELPGSHVVKASTINTIINIGILSGVDVKDVEITGGNYYGIKTAQSTTGEYLRNDIHHIGAYGISSYRMYNSIINFNNIYKCGGAGIYINSPTAPYPNMTIWENNIYDIALEPGMYNFNQSGDGSGIYAQLVDRLSILRNKITNVGRDGIMWYGDHVEIAYNDINYFCSVLQDHGAIYSFWSMTSYLNYRTRRIHHNFGSKGVGSPQGTASLTRRAASIIYMDGFNKWATIDHNSGDSFPRKMLNCNCDSSITFTDNHALMSDTIGQETSTFIGLQRQRPVDFRNLVVKNNVFYSFKKSQSTYYFVISGLASGASPQANIRSWGIMDSNYTNMANDKMFKLEYYNPGGHRDSMKLTDWQNYSLYDLHTIALPDYHADSVIMVKNKSDNTNVIPINGTWKDEKGIQYTSGISLPPWESKILMLVSSSSPSPISISFVDTMVTCFGFSNGKIYTTVSGGVPPYTYLWSNTRTTANNLNIPANNYSLLVTDAVFDTASSITSITQPTQLLVNASWGSITTPTGTTTVVISASGATPPYSGTGSFPNVGLGPHSYTVNDFNGCTVTKNITIVMAGRNYIKVKNVKVYQNH